MAYHGLGTQDNNIAKDKHQIPAILGASMPHMFATRIRF